MREGRVIAAITARMLLGRLGLHRPDLVLICLTARSSQAHEGDDLTNYGAFGPFVRSFYPSSGPGGYLSPTKSYLHLNVSSKLHSHLNELLN